MTAQDPSFVHLRVHTEYSMVDGIVRHKPLFQACRDLDYPAVAMTDQSNICGLVKFYRAANAAGVKPLVGVDAWVVNDDHPEDIYRVLLLCLDNPGYKNLTRLISRSYTEGQRRGKPIMQFSWLAEWNEGLLVLSGGREGDVGRALVANHPEQAAEFLARWKQYFNDRYYLEVQRTGREYEDHYIQQVIALAQGSQTPVVATNDVHFLFPFRC